MPPPCKPAFVDPEAGAEAQSHLQAPIARALVTSYTAIFANADKRSALFRDSRRMNRMERAEIWEHRGTALASEY